MSIDVFDPRVFARGRPRDDLRRLRDSEPVAWQEEPSSFTHLPLRW